MVDFISSPDSLTTTLNHIHKIQEKEREMYAKLNTATTNKALSPSDKSATVTHINELSAIRQELFKSLKDRYKFETDKASGSQSDILDQISTVEIVENELNNAKKTLDMLETDKNNKLRMVEINTYYSKRYEAQANIMKRLVLICIPLLILAVLMQKGKIPQRLGGALISAVLVIGVIMVGSLIYDLMKRDKMNFDKYTWFWNSAANDPTVIEYDRAQLEKIGAMDNIHQQVGAALGTCIGDDCCGETTRWNADKQICSETQEQAELIEGFNRLGACVYDRRKDYVNVFQDNGNGVKPFTDAVNFSSV